MYKRHLSDSRVCRLLLFLGLLAFGLTTYGETPASIQVKLAKTSLSACAGGKISLTYALTGAEEGAIEREWWKVGADAALNTTDPELILSDLAVSDTGRYYCVVYPTGAADRYYSDTLTLTVLAPEARISGPAVAMVGEELAFNVTAMDGAVYHWRTSDATVAIGSDAAYAFRATAGSDTVFVALSLTKEGVTCSASDSLAITLKPDIQLSLTGGGKFCEGEQATLSVLVSGTTQYTVAWQKDGQPIAGQTGEKLILNTLTPEQTGTYRCVVTDVATGETKTSGEKVLTVVAKPQALLTAPTDGSVYCYDAEQTFTAQNGIAGQTAVSYRWTVDGREVAGTGATLELPLRATLYKVYLDHDGCVDSAACALTLLHPQATISGNRTVTIGEEVSLSVAPQAGAVYSWKTSDATVASGTAAGYVFQSTADTDTAFVCVSLTQEALTCRAFDTATIQLNRPDIRVSLAGASKACVGGNVQLTLEVTGSEQYEVSWLKDGTDVTGEKDKLLLSAVTAADAGLYRCEVKDSKSGLTYSDELTLAVIALPQVQLLSPADGDIRCYNETVQFAVQNAQTGQTGVTCRWTEGKRQLGSLTTMEIPVTGTDYKVYLDHQGCVDSLAFQLEVLHPEARIQGKTDVTIGENLTFIVAEQAGAAYRWNTSDAGVAGGTDASYTFKTTTETDSVFVQVTLNSGSKQCTAADSVEITLRKPAVGVLVSGKTSVCEGDSVQMSATVTGSDNFTIAWYKGEQLLAGDRTTHTLYALKPEDSGEYSCRVTDRFSGVVFLSNRLTIAVHTYPQPRIVTPLPTDKICYGDLVTFTAQDALAEHSSTTYRWAVDGRKGTATGEITSFRVTGEQYKVYADYEGCVDSAEVILAPVTPLVGIANVTASIGSEVVMENPYQDGASYTWTMKDSYTTNTAGNQATFTVTPSTKEIYLTVGYQGCVRMDTAYIELYHENIKTETWLEGKSGLCVGDDLVLKALTTQSSDYVYTWYRYPSAAVGTNSAVLELKDVTTAQSGKYYCDVYDRLHDLHFMTDTLDVTISEYPGVRITMSADSKMNGNNVCAGDTLTLTAEAVKTNLTPVGCSWGNVQGQAMDGGRTIKVLANEDKTYYGTVIYKGCASIDSVKVTVRRPGVKIPNTAVGMTGEEVVLTATVPGGVSQNLYWYKAGAATPIASDVTEYRFTPSAAGVYNFKLEATSGPACERMDSCRVTVVDKRTLLSSRNDGFVVGHDRPRLLQRDTAVCEGTRLVLEVRPVGYDGYNYIWRRLKGNVRDAGFAVSGPRLVFDPIAMAEGGYRYFCEVADVTENAYVCSDTVRVTVNGRPGATITSPLDGDRFCSGAELLLNGHTDNGVRMSWLGENILQGQGSPQIRVKVGKQGTYRFIADNINCQDTAEILIHAIEEKVLIPSQLLLPQGGKEVTLTATKSESTLLQWYVNGEKRGGQTTVSAASLLIASSGTVVAEIEAGEDANGNSCFFRDTCLVLTRDFTPIVNTADDGFAISRPLLRQKNKIVSICRNNPATFEVYYRGFDDYVYEWRKVDESNPGTIGDILSDSICLVIPNCEPEDAGRYYCRVKDPDNNEYIYSDTAELVVEKGPVALITSPADLDACYGEVLEISASLVGGVTPDQLIWEGENILSGQGTTVIRVRVGEQAVYQVTASMLNGCSSVDAIELSVNRPQIDIAPAVFLNEPQTVEFTAQRKDMTSEVAWYINGGMEMSTADNPVALSLQKSGLVTASLKDGKCLAHDTCRVYVKEATTYVGGDNDGFIESRPRLEIIAPIKPELSVCPGSDVVLRVDRTSFSNYRYEWRKIKSGADDLKLGDGDALRIDTVNNDDAGRYYCVGYDSDGNGDGFVYSDTLYLRLLAGPLAAINDHDAGSTVCASDRITLDANNLNDKVSEVTYQWWGNGIVSLELNGASVDVLPVHGNPVYMAVSAVAEDAQGNQIVCSDTASVVYNVNRPGLTLPVQLELAAPEEAYVFQLTPPAGATVTWEYRSENGTTAGGGIAGNELKITEDGWAVARTEQDLCYAFDSCRVYVKGTTTFLGGDNDGFFALEVGTRVKLNPDVDTLYVCRDGRLNISVEVSGVGNYLYDWYCLSGETETWVGDGIDLQIDNLQEGGRYYCRLSDKEELDVKLKYTWSDTMTVLITPGPVAHVKPFDPDICMGKSVELDATATVEYGSQKNTYEWSGDDLEVLDDGKHVIARPRKDGIYVLSVSDGNCTDTALIRFNMSNPKVSIPEQLILAKPGNHLISAKTEVEGGKFKWYQDIWGVNGKDRPQDLYLSQDGLVIVGYQLEQCEGLDTMRVYVKMPETFNGGNNDGFFQSQSRLEPKVFPQYPEVCRGTALDIELSLNIEGRSLIYRWEKVGNGHREVANTKDLYLAVTQISDTGRYFCIVTDPAEEDLTRKTVYSDTAVVSVINGPIAQIGQPHDGDLVCLREVVDILADATENNKISNKDEYTYEWFGDDIIYTGREYRIQARMGENTRYVLKASMGECTTYDTVMLRTYAPEVRLSPTLFLSQSEIVNFTLPEEDPAKLRWYYYYPAAEAQILGDSVNKNSVNYWILEDAVVVVEKTGSEGGKTCIGIDSTLVFVKNTAGFIGGDGDGYVSAGTNFYLKLPVYTDTVCEGATATMYVEAVGDDFYRYIWRNEANQVVGEKSLCRIESIKASEEGFYTCEVVDVNNDRSVFSDRIYIKVIAQPKVAILADETDICYKDNVTLSVDRSLLKEGTGYRYFWQGSDITDPYTATTTFRMENGGTYYLQVNEGDCAARDSIVLNVEKPILEIQPIYQIKSGESVTLTATTNAPTLNWWVNNNPYKGYNPLVLGSVTQTTDVRVQTTGNCIVERTAQIYVRPEEIYTGGYDDGFARSNDLPQILQQCDEILGCDVDTATLWVSVLDAPGLNYRWQKNDGHGWVSMDVKANIDRVDTTSMFFSTITADDEGLYRCWIWNANGNAYTREIRLVKGGKPNIRVRMQPVEVCEGNPFTLGVDFIINNNGSRTGLNYKWYYSKENTSNFTLKTPLADYNKQSYTVDESKEADEGYYMLELSNYCGVVYDTAYQEIWEAPTFVRQPADTAVCYQSPLELKTELQGGGSYAYALWQVSLGKTGEIASFDRRIYLGNSPLARIDEVTEIDNGHFAWIGWNDCDSVVSQPFKVTVEYKLEPTFSFVDTTMCAGTDLKIVMIADGAIAPSSNIRYYWTRDNIRQNVTTTRYTINKIQPEDQGDYICYAYNSCPPQQLKHFQLKTQQRPVFLDPLVLDHADKGYCEGEEVNMVTGYTSDAGDVKVSWFHNGVEMQDVEGSYQGTHADRMTILKPLPADAGTYSVSLSNGCGTRASNAVTLKINEPVRFAANGSLEGQDAALCIGDEVNLQVKTTGMTPIYYTWMRGSTILKKGLESQLKITNIQREQGGVYECFLQNDCMTNSISTSASVEILTPQVYSLSGGGRYCRNDGREVTLSGHEQHVVYKLYRRSSRASAEYTLVKQFVGSDSTGTGPISFGYMEAGFYHAEATATRGTKVCESVMEGEIEIIRDATPDQYRFYVVDPICEGMSSGVLALEGSEDDADIEYVLQRYDADRDDWNDYTAAVPGTGQPMQWNNLPAGIYQVMATNVVSGCATRIGEEDTLAVRPYPQDRKLLALNGDTTACFGMVSDVVLQLENPESSCVYTLLKENNSTGREASGETVTWDTVRGGTYSVLATTGYGCQRTMGEVKVTDLPKMDSYLLSGGRVYCPGGAGDSCTLVLDASTLNVRYDFYAVGENDPLASYYGTGDYLKHKVEQGEATEYYVVAVDTLHHCLQEMDGRTTVEPDSLTVVTAPEMTLNANTEGRLEVKISKAMGQVDVHWEPSHNIKSENADYSATTRPLTRGDRFVVRVSDDYCTEESYIDVSIDGEPLNVKIKASDCYTEQDTFYVCEGEPVDLCSYIGGGNGKYTFKWSDDLNPDSIPVPQSGKLKYLKTQNGFVSLRVEAPYIDEEGNPGVQIAFDTVQVVIKSVAADILVGNPELTCVVPGTAFNIQASQLEEGVWYQLQYRSRLTDPFVNVGEAIQGRPEKPELEWSYPGETAMEYFGYYQLKVTKVYENQARCTHDVFLTEVRRGPEHRELEYVGERLYCAGSKDDTLYVDHSEADITYQLLRGKQVVTTQQGDGNRITFAGAYGTGDYRIVANFARCKDTLTDAANVTEQVVKVVAEALPKIEGLEGIQAYCSEQLIKDEKEPRDRVGITLPQQGVKYTLYNATTGQKIAEEAASVQAIYFALQKDTPVGGKWQPLDNGRYYILATSPQSLKCENKAEGLSIVGRPSNVTVVDNPAYYCEGEEHYSGNLRITGVDSLIDYALFEVLASGDRKTGVFEGYHNDTLYFNGSLKDTGSEYVVKADAGSCSTEVGTVDVKALKLPAERLLMYDTIGCEGLEMQMGIRSAMTNVVYELWREAEGSTEKLEEISNTDLPQDTKFAGKYTTRGRYYIVAINEAGCSRVLSSAYRIRKQPQLFRLEADASTYCEDTRGVKFSISGTEQEVIYTLQRYCDTLTVPEYRNVEGIAPIVGTNSGKTDFSGYHRAGTYRIMTDYCGLAMLDTLTITELALPEDTPLALDGKACIDSTMMIRIAKPENGTDYTLYFAGTSAGMPVYPGSGTVAWEIAAAQTGVYTVMAERNNCRLQLSDSIETGEVSAFSELKGMEELCALETRDLFIESWDNKAVYTLHDQEGKTDTIVGKVIDGKMTFVGVPAGFNYYVTAGHRSCQTEKGPFLFPGVPLPEYAEENFVVEDCVPDGQATVLLKNLDRKMIYELSSYTDRYTIDNFEGDSLIGKLPNGTYWFTVYDPSTGCTSQRIETSIRQAVPADSIVSRLAYCEELQSNIALTLSAQTFGVDYFIEDLDGNRLDSISGTIYFTRPLTAGSYRFVKRRTGLWGGCTTADTFAIEAYPMPNSELTVTTPDVICESGENAITIENSELRVQYLLQNTAGVNIDTIYGNGGAVSFTKRKPAGDYYIKARYEGLCETGYYRKFTVLPEPEPIDISDCSYCTVAGEPEEGCALEVKNLYSLSSYVLYDAAMNPVDTLSGIKAGSFKKHLAGDYTVKASSVNGCSAIVGTASIHRHIRPQVFPVTNMAMGGDCSSSVDMQLVDGCETDSVKYYLKINEFYDKAGPVTAYNGIVRFGSFDEPGTYKVYAVKNGQEDCGVWMDGSAVIFSAPKPATLRMNGIYCGEGVDSDMTLIAEGCEENWQYFVKSGVISSEKQEGIANEVLTWKQMQGGQNFASGKYYLYATNVCGTEMMMDSLEIKPVKPATPFQVKVTNDGYICYDATTGGLPYDFNLNGSEEGVYYSLYNAGDTLIGSVMEGTGNKDFYVSTVTEKGTYIVKAEVEATGCVYHIDTVNLIKESININPGTELQPGKENLCGQDGAAPEICIKLSVGKVPRVDYYLEVNGHVIDSVMADAFFTLNFNCHTELGCYYLIAASDTRHCNNRIATGLCLSEPPVDISFQGLKGEINMCQGEERVIALDSTQLGMTYELWLNKSKKLAVKVGDGLKQPFIMGVAKEQGTYYVRAAFDNCDIWMSDSLKVNIDPLPKLDAVPYYTYCEGMDSVLVEVLPLTEEGMTYYLSKNKLNNVVSWHLNADGRGFTFDDYRCGAGMYIVSTAPNTAGFKCTAYDTVIIEKISLPKYTLSVQETPYKCDPSEVRTLKLSGSKKGIDYTLLKEEDPSFFIKREGTGKPILFENLQDTGHFYVEASQWQAEEEMTCEVRMDSIVHIYVPKNIDKLQLMGDTIGYCHGSTPNGTVRLPSSQEGILYELYVNDLRTGQTKVGNRGPLKWTNLAGKSCSAQLGDEDANVYTVKASDGGCVINMEGSVAIIEETPVVIQWQTPLGERHACTGDSLGFAVSATGCHLTYEWLHNGNIVSQESGFMIDSVKEEDYGEYICYVSNTCQSVAASDPITVSVRKVVTLPNRMKDMLVCDEPQQIEFTSTAVGENYAWFKEGQTDTLSHNISLTIDAATSAQHAGRYVCQTWNECGGLADTLLLEFNRAPKVDYVVSRDTLCVNSAYEVNVESRDSLQWLKDGIEMPGYNGERFRIDALETGDAGNYQVKAINACSESVFNVMELLVDDTLKVVNAPDVEQHYCLNSTINLTLEVAPAERVSYVWKRNNNLMPTVKGNHYAVKATANENGRWYTIDYRNKCNSGSVTQSVYIDEVIQLAALRDTILCADPGRMFTTVAYDNANDRTDNTYSWYRRLSEGDKLLTQSDTLQINRSQTESGIYFCRVENTCGTKVTPDISIAVDSVPVILNNLKPQEEPICEHDSASFVFDVQGGDIEYTWILKKKDGTEIYRKYTGTAFRSESKETFRDLTVDYDSCTLCCIAENRCQTAFSDTILLRITPNTTLVADKLRAYLCSNASDTVKIGLTPSPAYNDGWNYGIRKNNGEQQLVPPATMLYAAADTLKFTERGIYKIDYFSTKRLACLEEDPGIEIVIDTMALFRAEISAVGKTEICLGEEVQLRIKINGGTSPWQVVIRDKDGNLTSEFGEEPMVMVGRDTLINLRLIGSRDFVLVSALQYLDPEACAGVVSGMASYKVETPYTTRFNGNTAQNSFGVCNTINLESWLQPEPAIAEGTGKFFLDGQLYTQSSFQGNPGRYHVSYVTTTSLGCQDSVSANFTIDELPEVTLKAASNNLCPGSSTSVQIRFSGAGPFDFMAFVRSYDTDGNMSTQTMLKPTSKVDSVYSFGIAYPATSIESRRTVTMFRVADAHGCAAASVADKELEVTMRNNPVFQLGGMVNNGNYQVGEVDFVVPKDQPQVNYRIYVDPQKLILPWTYHIDYTSPTGEKKEYKSLLPEIKPYANFMAVEQGKYLFTISDAYCSSIQTIEGNVTYIDKGYLVVKALLEGAYNDETGRMHSELHKQGLLKLETAGWKAWPEVGNREIIDWVTVELRKELQGKAFISGTYLMLSDGSIVGEDGNDTLALDGPNFSDLLKNEYYVVLKHRNHLAVASAVMYRIVSDKSDVQTADFRQFGEINPGSEGDVSDHASYFDNHRVWSMAVGDMIGNGLVSMKDVNYGIREGWAKRSKGYWPMDVNFDGYVTLPLDWSQLDGNDDISRIFKNRAKFSVIK